MGLNPKEHFWDELNRKVKQQPHNSRSSSRPGPRTPMTTSTICGTQWTAGAQPLHICKWCSYYVLTLATCGQCKVVKPYSVIMLKAVHWNVQCDSRITHIVLYPLKMTSSRCCNLSTKSWHSPHPQKKDKYNNIPHPITHNIITHTHIITNTCTHTCIPPPPPPGRSCTQSSAHW